MTEKEALTRVKTGNFGGDYGFDLQMLVDAVGIIGEMLKSGRISEVVRCKDCKHYAGEGMYCACDIIVQFDHFYCYDGERREDATD